MVKKAIENLDSSKTSGPAWIFFDQDSLHAMVNSQYETWS